MATAKFDPMTIAVHAIADFTGLIEDPVLSDSAHAVARLGRKRLSAAVSELNPTLTTLPDKMPRLSPRETRGLLQELREAAESLRLTSRIALEADEKTGPALRAAIRIEQILG